MSKAKTLQLWTTIHRYLGLASAIFLLIASLTGCFLCFDKSIDAALNPDLFSVPVSHSSLAPVEAIAHFERTHPLLQVTSFPLHVARGSTIEASVAFRPGFGPSAFDQAFIDPADGRLVGTRQTGPGWDRKHIVQGVFEFHYTMLAGTTGRWTMGVAALGWLIGNGVGFYLTFPAQKPFWRRWKRSWAIEWRARLRWLLLDVHRASGLWLFLGVMVLAFTSVAMNFFDEAFAPAVAAVSPANPSPFDKAPVKQAPAGEPIGYSRALAFAQEEAGERKLQWLPASASYLPERKVYGVMFTPSGQVAYRWLGPVTLFFEGQGGRFVYADDPYHDGAGRKLSRSLYPLHSGEVIGPAGVAIIFLLGLATAEMCVTGIYIWWKKRRSRLAMDAAKKAKVSA
jgi:uncharacterized iron-regulated membrane protein